MIVCNNASLGTVFPREPLYRTLPFFHECDDDSVFVTECRAGQKSGLSVIVVFAANKNSFQKSDNVARCFVSFVCLVCSDVYRYTSTEMHITLPCRVWIHSACRTARCANGDLSTTTSTFSQSSYTLLCTSFRLTLFNCCHSCWKYQSSCCAQSHARTLLDHSALECFHNVIAAPSKTARDLRMMLLCDARLSRTFLHVVQYRPGS